MLTSSTSRRAELLYRACIRDRLLVVQRLLRAATAEDLAWTSPVTAWTALHAAAEMRSPEIVHLLARAGAPIEARNSQGWTPLLLAVDADIDAAVQSGEALDLRTMEAFLDVGASPDAAAHDGTTPISLAMRYRCQAAVDALSKRRPTTTRWT